MRRFMEARLNKGDKSREAGGKLPLAEAKERGKGCGNAAFYFPA